MCLISLGIFYMLVEYELILGVIAITQGIFYSPSVLTNYMIDSVNFAIDEH